MRGWIREHAISEVMIGAPLHEARKFLSETGIFHWMNTPGKKGADLRYAINNYKVNHEYRLPY
jgi:hypothetical protein